MAERADAQFPKIRIRKIGQNGEIDVVLDECGCVASKPELFEPTGYFRRRAARSFGLFSIFLVRFHGYRQPSPARLGTRPLLRSDRNFTHARSSSAAPNRPNATASAGRKARNFRVSLMARPCETQSSTKIRRILPGLDPEQYQGKTKLMLLVRYLRVEWTHPPLGSPTTQFTPSAEDRFVALPAGSQGRPGQSAPGRLSRIRHVLSNDRYLRV